MSRFAQRAARSERTSFEKVPLILRPGNPPAVVATVRRVLEDMKRSALVRRRPTYPSADALRERAEWGAAFDRCHVCREKRTLDIHEIARRSKSSEWCCKENFLVTCRQCHDSILSWLPAVVQCAIKFIEDRELFDLNTINKLRHREQGAISWGEVHAWVQLLNSVRGN